MDWTGVSQKAKLNQQLSIFRKWSCSTVRSTE
jgi:hypothetical protein